IYKVNFVYSFTYDHRTMKTGLPVRSALHKHRTGGLVVKWVTIGESLLLYVFDFFFCTPFGGLAEGEGGRGRSGDCRYKQTWLVLSFFLFLQTISNNNISIRL
ncbi:hypothetical protein K504DRAFT_374756, partial [Pleomassaria siparia CBS 279.74]